MVETERSLIIPPPDADMLANVRTFAENAKAIVVGDLASREGAALALREVATFAKVIDDDRKRRTRPLDAEKKAVMDEYRPVEAELAGARAALTNSITAFDKAEREKAAAEQKRLDEEAAKERARLERLSAKAEERGDYKKAEEFDDRALAVATQAPIATAPPKISGVSTRKVWRCEVVDKSKLPDRYLIADQKALDEAVRRLGEDAINLIPGLRVWAEELTVVRGL